MNISDLKAGVISLVFYTLKTGSRIDVLSVYSAIKGKISCVVKKNNRILHIPSFFGGNITISYAGTIQLLVHKKIIFTLQNIHILIRILYEELLPFLSKKTNIIKIKLGQIIYKNICIEREAFLHRVIKKFPTSKLMSRETPSFETPFYYSTKLEFQKNYIYRIILEKTFILTLSQKGRLNILAYNITVLQIITALFN